MSISISQLFKNFKPSEISYLESKIGNSLFETNNLLYNELDSIIFMYDSVEAIRPSTAAQKIPKKPPTPTLPPLLANTKERILLCTNIVNLVEELNGLGLEYEKEKSLDMEMVKYCYKLANSEKENSKILEKETGQVDTDIESSRDSRPNTANSISSINSSNHTNSLTTPRKVLPNTKDLKSTILNSIKNSRPKINLNENHFKNNIDEITSEHLQEIKNVINIENNMLKDQIKLINFEIDRVTCRKRKIQLNKKLKIQPSL